jgi:CheY-like chemotaxis protein
MSESTEATGADAVRLKILIVDDESDVKLLFQQRFRKELRSGEMSFLFALSGEEALNLYATDEGADVILILSDINMPGMTGLELLGRMKQDRPELPVLMITAYGDDNTRQKAMSMGADEFVTKPIDFGLLKERMRALALARWNELNSQS